MKLVWYGGYTNQDFDIYEAKKDKTNSAPLYYMSAARIVSFGKKNSVLVINIDMDYFTSIYNNSSNSSDNMMYIIEDTGRIISHSDVSMIGTQSRTYRQMDPKSSVQDFIVSNKGEQNQVLYYRLSRSGWILVDEVPMKVITRDFSYLRNILLVIFLIGLASAIVFSGFWVYGITKPLNILTKVMNKIEGGSLGQTFQFSAKNELGELVKQFNRMSVSIKELMLKNELTQKEKSLMEMQALQSQINPHFIYNTLNTIKWMALMSNAGNVAECLTTLSDFLEPIFKKRDMVCRLEEEIKYIDNYIKIINYRFAGGLKVNFKIAEEFQRCLILRFILQPVIENAIIHGLMDRNKGEIDISAWEDGGDIIIRVADNGEGISEGRLTEITASLGNNADPIENTDSRVGLNNINRRIQLHYGATYGVGIHSIAGGGTEVFLRMPFARQS